MRLPANLPGMRMMGGVSDANQLTGKENLSMQLRRTNTCSRRTAARRHPRRERTGPRPSAEWQLVRLRGRMIGQACALSVLWALLALAAGCADRSHIHPLAELLYRCSGKWQVDADSARRFPDLVAGRETIEIQVTERLETPRDGSWQRGTTYGHGSLSVNGATCPVDFVTTPAGILHPYIRYAASCIPSGPPDMDPNGFAFIMDVTGGSSAPINESDHLYVDYRRSRPSDNLYPGRELVLYTRAAK